jgi:hypothetical protein
MFILLTCLKLKVDKIRTDNILNKTRKLSQHAPNTYHLLRVAGLIYPKKYDINLGFNQTLQAPYVRSIYIAAEFNSPNIKRKTMH